MDISFLNETYNDTKNELSKILSKIFLSASTDFLLLNAKKSNRFLEIQNHLGILTNDKGKFPIDFKSTNTINFNEILDSSTKSEELQNIKPIDLVFCRILSIEFDKIEDIIKYCTKHLNEEGRILIEMVDFSTISSYPKLNSIFLFNEMYKRMYDFDKIENDFGAKVFALKNNESVKNFSIKSTQPIGNSEELGNLIPILLNIMNEQNEKQKIMNKVYFDKLMKLIVKHCHEPQNLISYPKVFQIVIQF